MRGLPEGNQHNKQAFYSCNKELFGDETPHITDFHDKIIGQVESEALTAGYKLGQIGEDRVLSQ